MIIQGDRKLIEAEFENEQERLRTENAIEVFEDSQKSTSDNDSDSDSEQSDDEKEEAHSLRRSTRHVEPSSKKLNNILTQDGKFSGVSYVLNLNQTLLLTYRRKVMTCSIKTQKFPI